MSIRNTNRNASNMNITNSSSVGNIVSTTYEEHEYSGHFVSFPGHEAPKMKVVNKDTHNELLESGDIDNNAIYLIKE